MSFLLSFSMFFLSFLPLWISVVFLDGKNILDGTPYIGTEMIGIMLILIGLILSLICLMTLFDTKKQNGVQPYVLASATEEKTITSEFLLSYILPLVAFDFTVWYEVVLFLVFFIVFAFLSIRHNHFSVNIVLELLGYRFYSCALDVEGIPIYKMIISKEKLTVKINDKLYIRPVNNEYSVHIDTGKELVAE